MLRSQRSLFRCLIALLFLGVCSPRVNAASLTSCDLSGTVRSTNHDLVPGAQVRLTDTRTGWSRVQPTNANGRYLFSGIPYSNRESMTLSIERAGYASVRLDGGNCPALNSMRRHVVLIPVAR